MSSDRGHLTTETANPRTKNLDELSTLEAVDLFTAEDRAVYEAVRAAREPIARAVDLIAARMRTGGRLFYVGAGTSGRLGALDAAECPPTFQSDPETVQAVLAGGPTAMTNAVEGAEDSTTDAGEELERRGLSESDVVFGISAGGTTPFVQGAIRSARERGAATVFLACVSFAEVSDEADVSIRVVTGPEVLAGSTRLKAGTATKLVLNTVSTLVMVGLGKVHGNLMVDVKTGANTKLVDRGERLVMAIADVDRESAREALLAADGQVKLAVLMNALDVDAATAGKRLASARGFLRKALEADDPR